MKVKLLIADLEYLNCFAAFIVEKFRFDLRMFVSTKLEK